MDETEKFIRQRFADGINKHANKKVHGLLIVLEKNEIMHNWFESPRHLPFVLHNRDIDGDGRKLLYYFGW